MSEAVSMLDAIYRELGPVVRGFFFRRIGNIDVADELLQETFLAAAARPDRLFAATSHRAWLIGIAANVLRNHRRRLGLTRAAPLEVDPPDRRHSNDDPREEALRIAIGQLPEAQREALRLRLADNLTYAEISEAMGIPIGTVRSRIHNAIVALRKKLDQPQERHSFATFKVDKDEMERRHESA